MSGREVREYTNLTDPKDKKLGKGWIDDEDTTFQRMVAKIDLSYYDLFGNLKLVFLNGDNLPEKQEIPDLSIRSKINNKFARL